MRLKAGRVFLFLMMESLCLLSGSLAGMEAQEAIFAPELVREDLDFLWRTIKDVHPRYDHRVPKEDLERRYADLVSSTVAPLDRAGVYLSCGSLVSLIGDAHTFLEFQLTSEHEVFFPLDLLFIEDRAFLKRSYAGNADARLGSQVVSINQIPLDDLAAKMEALLPGECRSMKKRSLETDLFKVYCRFFFRGADRFQVRFRREDGVEETETLLGVERNIISSARRKNAVPERLLDLTLDTAAKTALLKVKTLEGEELPAFFARSFRQMREEGIQRLLIDLRDNLGGDSENAEELMSYLIEAPGPLIPRMGIRASRAFLDRMREKIPRWIRWLPLQNLSSIGNRIRQSPGEIVTYIDDDGPAPKPERLRFRGATALLINGHTLSSASLLAQGLKKRGRVLVLGQESGYAADGSFFEPLSFSLPHSGLTLKVSSMVLLDQEDRMRESSEGVIPDFRLNPRLADEIAGKDSLLEQAWVKFRDSASAVVSLMTGISVSIASLGSW